MAYIWSILSDAYVTFFLVTIINKSYPTNGVHLINLIRCLRNVLWMTTNNHTWCGDTWPQSEKKESCPQNYLHALSQWHLTDHELCGTTQWYNTSDCEANPHSRVMEIVLNMAANQKTCREHYTVFCCPVNFSSLREREGERRGWVWGGVGVQSKVETVIITQHSLLLW